MVKTTYWIQHKKNKRGRKNGDKDEKALYKFVSNSIYEKAMENVKNWIDVKLVNNEIDY